MKDQVTIAAPAKINLTLDVKGRRPDGYHELETIMHQVDLVDIVHLRRTRSGITVASDSSLVPTGEENLAYMAAREFFLATGSEGGVDIYIEKRIPVAAGLAGGSTDAAAVIKGLNLLYASKLGLNEMLTIGEKIGSDVPFCISGGTVLARGRGELLTPLEIAGSPIMVLVKPGVSVSTGAVYQGLAGRNIIRRPATREVILALARGDWQAAGEGMENVLEVVTLEWYPEVASIKAALAGLGAKKALMSGSGPGVFAIFGHADKARKAYNIMKKYYQDVFYIMSWKG